MAKVFSVTFDFKSREHSDSIMSRLDTKGNEVALIMPNMGFVSTEMNVNDLYNLVRPLFSSRSKGKMQENIFISEIKAGTYQGNLHPRVDEWLDSHLSVPVSQIDTLVSQIVNTPETKVSTRRHTNINESPVNFFDKQPDWPSLDSSWLKTN